MSTWKDPDFWKRAGISGIAFGIGLGTEFVPGIGTGASIGIGLALGLLEDFVKAVLV
jgi:hypothetical protein